MLRQKDSWSAYQSPDPPIQDQSHLKREGDRDSAEHLEYVKHAGVSSLRTSRTSRMSHSTFQSIPILPRSMEPTPAQDADLATRPMATVSPSRPDAQPSSYSLGSKSGTSSTPLGIRRMYYATPLEHSMTRPAVPNRTSSPLSFSHPSFLVMSGGFRAAATRVPREYSSDAPPFPIPTLSDGPVQRPAPLPKPSDDLESTSFRPYLLAANLAPSLLLHPIPHPLPQAETTLLRPTIPPGPIVHPSPRSIQPEVPRLLEYPLAGASPTISPASHSPVQATSEKNLDPNSSERSSLQNLDHGEGIHSQVVLNITNCETISHS
jgi:hypothetical protein